LRDFAYENGRLALGRNYFFIFVNYAYEFGKDILEILARFLRIVENAWGKKWGQKRPRNIQET
jgi:hypothetical protein